MSAAELIRDIHRHGGDVTVDGDDLNLTAPQPLPAGLLNQLRTHKAELLAYFNRHSANSMGDPTGPCPDCGCGQWWQLPSEPWHCRACAPHPPLIATTLTVDGVAVPDEPVPRQARGSNVPVLHPPQATPADLAREARGKDVVGLLADNPVNNSIVLFTAAAAFCLACMPCVVAAMLSKSY